MPLNFENYSYTGDKILNYFKLLYNTEELLSHVVKKEEIKLKSYEKITT